jgi:di- and tripeptidase
MGADGVVPSTVPDDDPTLLQRIKHEGSVLSLAVSDEYIFAGTQRKNILVPRF